MDFSIVWLLSVVLTLALAQHPSHAEMQALKKACQTEVGATDAEADSIIPFQVPTTRGASCILACLQKRWGMMNADNTFNSAVAIQKMSDLQGRNVDVYNKMTAVINTCKAQEAVHNDQCDAALTLATCMQAQRAAQGLTDFPYHH